MRRGDVDDVDRGVCGESAVAGVPIGDGELAGEGVRGSLAAGADGDEVCVVEKRGGPVANLRAMLPVPRMPQRILSVMTSSYADVDGGDGRPG